MGKSWTFKANKGIEQKIRGAQQRGLALAAEHVMGVAVDRTPIEEGNLRRSASTSVDDRGRRAAISYSSPYAVPVHEVLNARHPKGQAKFLESALNSEKDAVREILRKTIAGEL